MVHHVHRRALMLLQSSTGHTSASTTQKGKYLNKFSESTHLWQGVFKCLIAPPLYSAPPPITPASQPPPANRKRQDRRLRTSAYQKFHILSSHNAAPHFKQIPGILVLKTQRHGRQVFSYYDPKWLKLTSQRNTGPVKASWSELLHNVNDSW